MDSFGITNFSTSFLKSSQTLRQPISSQPISIDYHYHRTHSLPIICHENSDAKHHLKSSNHFASDHQFSSSVLSLSPLPYIKTDGSFAPVITSFSSYELIPGSMSNTEQVLFHSSEIGQLASHTQKRLSTNSFFDTNILHDIDSSDNGLGYEESERIQMLADLLQKSSLKLNELILNDFKPPKLLRCLRQCTLQQLLKHKTLSWEEFIGLTQQLCSALAFLHKEQSWTAFSSNDELSANESDIRGCFVLRNLRSNRLAITSDGRILVYQLNYALFCPSYSKSGQPLIPIRVCDRQPIVQPEFKQNFFNDFNSQQSFLSEISETVLSNLDKNVRKKLADEGLQINSLEYCAPELLRQEPLLVGLLDARLRQVDIYALGVCIWEMASRTNVLYQGVPPPAYLEPLAQELKFAQMRRTRSQLRLLVDAHQTRPLFPDLWKDSNLAIRGLKDIMEDCWDPEPEARVSVFCVRERLKQVLIDWEEHRTMIARNVVSKITNSNLISKVCNSLIDHHQDAGHQGSTTSNTTLESGDRCLTKNEQNCLYNRFTDSQPITMQKLPFQGQNLCMQRNLLSLFSEKFAENDEKPSIRDCTSKFFNQKQSNMVLASQMLDQTSEVLSFLDNTESSISPHLPDSPSSTTRQLQSINKSPLPLKRNLLKPPKQLNLNYISSSSSGLVESKSSWSSQELTEKTFISSSSTKEQSKADHSSFSSSPVRPLVKSIGSALKMISSRKWLIPKPEERLYFCQSDLIELDSKDFPAPSLTNPSKSSLSGCTIFGGLHRVAELTTS